MLQRFLDPHILASISNLDLIARTFDDEIRNYIRPSTRQGQLPPARRTRTVRSARPHRLRQTDALFSGVPQAARHSAHRLRLLGIAGEYREDDRASALLRQ